MRLGDRQRPRVSAHVLDPPRRFARRTRAASRRAPSFAGGGKGVRGFVGLGISSSAVSSLLPSPPAARWPAAHLSGGILGGGAKGFRKFRVRYQQDRETNSKTGLWGPRQTCPPGPPSSGNRIPYYTILYTILYCIILYHTIYTILYNTSRASAPRLRPGSRSSVSWVEA